jgi:alkylation response protein AidB-like acyl-CoA dehydrogenase
MLGVRGRGYQTVLERLMGMRMGVAFQGVGVAERAYDMAKSYAKERHQFNKPIDSFPGVSNKLRGMEINLTRMRKFAFEGCFVLSQFQRGQIPKTKYISLNSDEEKTLEEFQEQYTRGVLNNAISKAKMYNTEVGYMIVDDALQIFGGYGYTRDYKVEKLLRDCRILRIYEGTSEIQEYILNRSKGVSIAKNMNDLMQVASATEVPAPAEIPLDYADIFFRRFASVMDVYLDENGDTRYLFD